VFHTPQEYIKQKIYATEYPFASNGEKPSVNDAIIKAVNDGTLFINYIGHGSPDVWADEHILKKSNDLSRMNNTDKLMVVIAASCSIGKFDIPGMEGMAEMLFRQDGGAIETVSATRLVYATSNAIFGYDLYDAIFGNHCNVSEGVFTAKMIHQYTGSGSLIRNDRSFVVFGDPLSPAGLPAYKLEFETGTDSILTPLQKFSFVGQVNDLDDNPVNVDGQIEISTYDSRFIISHPKGIEYTLNGPSIFRGTVEVDSGRFEGQFIVPLDIDYGGIDAQITGYGILGASAGIGSMNSLPIAANAGTTSDNSGPEIQYLVDENPDFVSGQRIPANATLVLEISDVSGINLTGGLGHRIELIIDNDNNSTINLTNQFSYEVDSYQSGEVRYILPDLSAESHSFKIKAWDNANNPSTVEFEATPTREGHIAILDVMNYPNPMEESTEFFFELSEAAERVELQIFTLSGRIIRNLSSDNLQFGRNRQFYWDGRDFDGDRVAEGVYIYKITARGNAAMGSKSSDNRAEAFGKLVLLN
jgi:hypothetical protein